MRDPQEAPYILCGECLTEFYEGEALYTWENKLICGECLREKVNDMNDGELADLLGSETVIVERRKRASDVY
jgi:hypothetical protein